MIILFRMIDMYSLFVSRFARYLHLEIHKRAVLGTPDTPYVVVVFSHAKDGRRSIECRTSSRRHRSLLGVLIFISGIITDHCVSVI